MKVTCVGCSCLCDDVIVEIEDKIIVKHACRIGSSIFLNYNKARVTPMIEGNPVDFDKALSKAIDIIKDSKSLAIYGLDYTTIEAQKVAVGIVKKVNGYIKNSSELWDLAKLADVLKTTTLENVKDYAYGIIYWGIDVHNSMPRHMARYSYYPRGKKTQRGYEDRYLVVIDVRRSHTAMLVKRNARFIEVNDDLKLVEEFINALDGRSSNNDVMEVVKNIKKSDFNVIFGGAGLKLGLKNGLDKFVEMVRKMDVYFIPIDPKPNAMGFYKIVGSGDSFIDLLKKDEIDTVVVVGVDALEILPFDIARKLAKINTIVISAKRTFTAEIAKVVIPSSIPGVECGGTMVRHDGVEMKLRPPFKSEYDDVKILKKIEEEL